MGGGRLRRPPLINYQFYIKTIPKICIKTCQKYTKNTPQEKHQNTKTPTRAMPRKGPTAGPGQEQNIL